MSNFEVVYKMVKGQPVPFIVQKQKQAKAELESKPKKKGAKKNV